MKNRIQIKYFMLVLLAVFAMGCTPEDGEDGAIGPQGEQGIQGEQGAEGTANVFYSDWLDQDFNLSDGTSSKSMKVDEPMLTDDFFDEGGIVLGFFRFTEGVQENLPYESSTRNTRRSLTAISFDDRGELRFSLKSTDDTALTDIEVNGSGLGVQAQFKYVLIPGVTLLTGRSQQLNFKKMTYHEVMDHFGLDY